MADEDKTQASATAAALELDEEPKDKTVAAEEPMLEDEPEDTAAMEEEPIEEPAVTMSADGLLSTLADATGLTAEDVLVKLTKMVDGLAEKINAMADAEQGAAAMSNKPKNEDEAAKRRERLEKSALTARIAKLEAREAERESERKAVEAARKSALSARVKVEAKRLIDDGHQLDSAKDDLIAELSEAKDEAELDRRVRLLSAGKVVPISQSKREVQKDDKGNVKYELDDLSEGEKKLFHSLSATGVFKSKQRIIERVIARREN